MILLLTENRGNMEHFLDMDERQFLTWWEEWEDILRERAKK